MAELEAERVERVQADCWNLDAKRQGEVDTQMKPGNGKETRRM